jgi:TRAP-type C4-dicarboxylate transport system permease small subunit
MKDMIVTLLSEMPLWKLAVSALILAFLIVFRETVWRIISAVAQIGIWIGGAMLLAAAMIVTAEVLLRKGVGALLGTSFLFSGSDEISGYLFAVGTSLSLAHVLVHRGHVRIDVLYIQFNSRARAIMDITALLVMAIFVAALLERAVDVAATSYVEQIRSNTQLRIPLAWSQIPWAFGIALFFLAILVALIRSLAAVAKGDWLAVNRISGVATTEEEIATELKGLDVHSRKPSQGT